MLKAKALLAVVTTAWLALSYLAPVAQAADANAGADSYDANCSECHSLANPLKNKKGPGLFGVTGRAAASVPSYNYSDALKGANLKWTADKLDAYIVNPKALVPGTSMKFKGLSDAKERGDLLEFISQQR